MLIYLQMIENPDEQRKFEKIYREYGKLMFAIARRILDQNEDAEDATHDAFIAIAKNIKSIGNPVSPQTKRYVTLAAEHSAINLLKKRGIRNETGLDEKLPGADWEGEVNDELTRCILQLPENYRTIILLKYAQGYSTKEVAKMLGISDGYASKLDQRAKAKLEEICRKEGVMP